MKIFAFGPDLVSIRANPAAVYQRGVLRALADLGHAVIAGQLQGRENGSHPEGGADLGAVEIRRWRSDADLATLVAEANHADAVLAFGGLGDRFEEPVTRVAALANVVHVYWELAPLATLGAMSESDTHPLRGRVKSFDLVVARGGGPMVRERFLEFGARRVITVDNGVDPRLHHPVEPEEELACDLVFLGNRLEDREERVREFFFHVAGAMPERSFLLVGSGWDDVLPPNVQAIDFMPPERHSALNVSARLVLDVHGEAEMLNGHVATERLFEAAAAGACVVTDGWAGLPDYYEPDREVLVAATPGDVARLLRQVDAGKAKEIGEAARRRTLEEHTYAARVRSLGDELLGARGPIRRTPPAAQ